MKKLLAAIRRWYDDVLVLIVTAFGVFVNGIMPSLLAVQKGSAAKLPEVSMARLVTAGIIALVIMLLEAAKAGGGADAKAGRQKPVNLATRLALGFSIGYTLTGLTG